MAAKLTALNPPRRNVALGAAGITGVVLLAILAVAFVLGLYVALPLVLGILVFPSLLGLTGWGVFLSTLGSFAGVWLVLGLLQALNKK
ncbi:hypothetical protein GMYAFLOJ_CDS0047 [Microbacterium phage phiMiGM15]